MRQITKTIILTFLLLCSYGFGYYTNSKKCDKYISDIEEVVTDIIADQHHCISVCNKQCKWKDVPK